MSPAASLHRKGTSAGGPFVKVRAQTEHRRTPSRERPVSGEIPIRRNSSPPPALIDILLSPAPFGDTHLERRERIANRRPCAPPAPPGLARLART